METFTLQFLCKYHSARATASNEANRRADPHTQQSSGDQKEPARPNGQGDSSSPVLQEAENEKVKN